MNEALAARARQFSDANPEPSRGLRTVPLAASKLGQYSGAIGAASLPLFAKYFAGAVNDTFSNYRNERRASPGVSIVNGRRLHPGSRLVDLCDRRFRSFLIMLWHAVPCPAIVRRTQRYCIFPGTVPTGIALRPFHARPV
jgi:hypothetical protein